MLVYDITNYKTFRNIDRWAEEVKKYADTNVVLMLVGNKSDLKQKKAVNTMVS